MGILAMICFDICDFHPSITQTIGSNKKTNVISLGTHYCCYKEKKYGFYWDPKSGYLSYRITAVIPAMFLLSIVVEFCNTYRSYCSRKFFYSRYCHKELRLPTKVYTTILANVYNWIPIDDFMAFNTFCINIERRKVDRTTTIIR